MKTLILLRPKTRNVRKHTKLKARLWNLAHVLAIAAALILLYLLMHGRL